MSMYAVCALHSSHSAGINNNNNNRRLVTLVLALPEHNK